MLDLGWRCSYSEVRGELFSILPPYFWSSTVWFPDAVHFGVHLAPVAHRKSDTINPVHFTSCFFTFEYTSIHLCGWEDLKGSHFLSSEGEVQTFTNRLLIITEKDTSNGKPVSYKSFTVFNTLNSFDSSCSLVCFCLNVVVPH